MRSDSNLDPDRAAFLLIGFRDFWAEVEAVRAAIEQGPVDAPTARMRLRDVLAQQTALAQTSGPPSVLDTSREAQYVMVAAADDVFVQLPWTGAGEWMLHPLELDVFGSRCAGQSVFDRIDALVGGDSPNGSDLAPIYLAALALGFQGMYAGRPDSDRELGEYRERLRARAGGTHLDGPLVPQCYHDTIELKPGSLLSGARAWWWAAAAIVGAWLITSSLLWQQLSGGR